MKTRHFLTILVSACLTCTISSAQTPSNPNPYAIFEKKRCISGGQTQTQARVQLFEVDHVAGDSPVVRLEHDTQTGIVTLFDIADNRIKQTHLKRGHRAWGVPDPKSEKYYPVSPYAFVADNPIKYVDPDGTTIQVHDFVDNQRITYEWRQYEGNWGFYNSDNALYAGNNKFVGQLSGALSGLMNGGQTGFDLVSAIANHSNVVNIQAPTAKVPGSSVLGNYLVWASDGIRNDGTIEQVPTTRGMRSDPMMTLGHELGHIEYNWSGGETRTWFNMPTSETQGRSISVSEIHTMHRENKMRSEHGLPLRTHYGADASGFGYGPRVIVPSTGASRYYNAAGVTNYRPIGRKVAPYIY